MSKNSVKISVIVPVWNTESYLRRCLDSLVAQTLQDIEVICINDGSPDNSLAILKEYGAKDSRIKIINFEQNQGVSAARNAGIDAAQGEYLGFVDSDDWAELDFYEKLYTRAKETNADIVKGNEKLSDDVIKWNLNEEIKKDRANFLCGFSSAIYRKLILDGIRFPNLSHYEDPVFSFQAGLLANKIEIVDDAFINITKRETSASYKIFNSPQKVISVFNGIQMLLDIVNNSTISEASYCATICRVIKHYTRSLFANGDGEIKKIVAEKTTDLCKQIKYKNSFRDEKFNEILFFAACGRLYSYLVNPAGMLTMNYLRTRQRNLTYRNTQKILSLKDKHKGDRCFIVGSSPSLNQLDLTKLAKEYIFTVNRNFRLAANGLKRSNYHVMSDKKLFWVDKVCSELPTDFAEIFFIWAGINFTAQIENVIYFDYKRDSDFQTDLTKPIWGFPTVIAFAIQIAYYMGFKDIYLIGVDWDFKNYPGHAYGATKGEQERQLTTSVPEAHMVLEGLARSTEFLKAHGVNLYNASVAGAVDCMPRVKYEDLFDDLLAEVAVVGA